MASDTKKKESVITEDDVKRLKTKIAVAKRLQRDHLDVWKRMVEYLKGKYFKFADEEDRVSVNLVYGIVNTIIPLIYHRNPKVTLSSQRNSMVNNIAEKYSQSSSLYERPYSPRISAQILEKALDYWFRVTKLKRTVRKNLSDSLLQGYGAVKVGYASNPTDGFKLSVKRISPRDLLFPIGTTEMDDSDIVIHRILMSPEEVKAKTNYKNTKDIKGQTYLTYPKDSDKEVPEYSEDEVKRTTLYEVWNKKTNYVTTICDEHDKELENKKFEVWPFAYVSFNWIPEELYPQSDIAILEPQFMEINTYRSRMLRHNRRFNRKYIVDSNSLSDKENQVRKLEYGEDGTIVLVDGKPSESIAALQDAPMSNDQYMGERLSRMDLLNISGISEDQLGGGQKAGPRQTATQAGIVAQNLNSKMDFRLDIVEDFIEDIAQILIKYLKSKFTKPEMAVIVGDNDIEWPLEWTKDDIQGEYDVIVEAGSSTKLDEKNKTMELMQLFNLVAPAAQMLNVDPLPLLDKILHRSKTLSDKEITKILRGQDQDPEKEIRHAEQENEYMIGGHEEEITESDNHQLHAIVHERFMQSEQFMSAQDDDQRRVVAHRDRHLQLLKQGQYHQQNKQMGGMPMNPGLLQNPQQQQMAGQMQGGFNSPGMAPQQPVGGDYAAL